MIVASGTGVISDAVEALHQGAWDYLLKPIQDYSLLIHAVSNALEKARLRQENHDYQQDLERMVSKRTEELNQANNSLSHIITRLRHIVDTTRALSFCTEVKQFGSLLLQEFGEHMHATGGSLYLKEKEGMRLIHSLDPGHAARFIPLPFEEGSVFHLVVSQKQPLLIQDIESDTSLAGSSWKGYKDASTIVFPLPDESGDIVGILTLHSKTLPPFGEEDKEIGQILSAYSCEALRAVRSAEKIRESEKEYRSILNTATDAIVSISEDGHIYICNKSAEKMFGYTKKKMIGTPFQQLLVPEANLKNVEDFLKRFFKKGQGIILGQATELTALRKNGDEFPIELSLSSFKIAGKWHATGIIRDITVRRITENNIKKALKEKEVLLQEVNHRVKNNLNVIISLLNLKADSIVTGKDAMVAFEESRDLVYSMAMVHEELYQSIDFTEIKIKDYIENLTIRMVEIYQPIVEIKYKLQIADVNIDITKAIPCGMILTELVTNALKHAFNDKNGDGLLEISCSKLETGIFYITVKDNGSGIPGDVDIQNPKSSGLQLVNILTSQIDGQISINTDNGTEFIISFSE
jgi:PAS domain S-box-containing protein